MGAGGVCGYHGVGGFDGIVVGVVIACVIGHARDHIVAGAQAGADIHGIGGGIGGRIGLAWVWVRRVGKRVTVGGQR